jgi:hypothetical protein
LCFGQRRSRPHSLLIQKTASFRFRTCLSPCKGSPESAECYGCILHPFHSIPGNAVKQIGIFADYIQQDGNHQRSIRFAVSRTDPNGWVLMLNPSSGRRESSSSPGRQRLLDGPVFVTGFGTGPLFFDIGVHVRPIFSGQTSVDCRASSRHGQPIAGTTWKPS